MSLSVPKAVFAAVLGIVGGVKLTGTCHAQTTSISASGPTTLTPQQMWLHDWAVPPNIPLVGDLDGDGRADFVAFAPRRGGAEITLCVTSALGKPCFPVPWTAKFGKADMPVAAACAAFGGPSNVGARTIRRTSIIVICHSGAVWMISDYDPKTHSFMRNESIATIPAALLPTVLFPRTRFRR